jgi:DNA (cytosine-5)-methyltransferase 1
MKIRGGKEGGGKGILCQHDKSATLGCNNDQTLFQPAYGIAKEAFSSGENAAFNFAVNEEVSPTLQATGPGAVAKPDIKAFGVCSKQSHAMLSDNPHSGFYEAETSRTLDQGGGNPACNQGGICIVAPAPDGRETYDVRFTSDGTKNARGHCYKTDISRCLDTSEANPDSNHGGVAVVEKQPVAFTKNQRNEVRNLGEQAGALSAQPGMKQQTYVLQGSMIGREDKNGPQGGGINEDVSFTLNTIDRHAVVAPVDDEHATYCATTGSFMTVDKEKTPPLMARDYKDPQVINDTETPDERDKPEPVYIVRRLTPVECARLQGFPDWWCSGLAIPNPSDEELAYWAEIWETWRKLTNPNGKPKTEKQLRKWLADPYTDAAEYKLWGNGVAVPCVYFVLSGIEWVSHKNDQ